MSQNKITIIDTTLRDGLQHEEHYMSLERRLALLDMLVSAGVTDLEIGSLAHPEYLPQFREVDQFLMSVPKYPEVEYTVLALNRRAVDRAVKLKEAGAPIHRALTGQLATSPAYARKNMNRTHEELFAEAEELVKILRDNGIRVCGNVGTIFGCPILGEMPLERAYEFCERLFDMGCEEIEHADTEGTATPDKVEEYFSEVMKRWPDPAKHVFHIHDVKGAGLACYYAAAKQGVRKFECTLGGIGGQPANRMDGVAIRGTGEYYYTKGRTGLVSLEDFAAMMDRMGENTGIEIDKITAAGCQLEEYLGRALDSFVVAAAVKR